MNTQKDKLIESCLELLRIDSLTGQENEISAFLEQDLISCLKQYQLKKAGLSLCYFGEQDPSLPTIGLFGHLDTVHNQQDEAPYSNKTHVYGCGASDMKGGVTVMRELIHYSLMKKQRFNLIFVFYHSEEGPYIENGLGDVLEAMPELQNIDFSFVLEPTNNSIQTGCLGVINAKVHFHGKSCHSARPWLGENAIHKAADVLQKLKKQQVKGYNLDGLQFYEVINATIAQGGKTRNVIPNFFTLNVNYRFSPTKTEEEARQEFAKIVTEGEVEILDCSPSGPTCFNNKLFQEFQQFSKCAIEPKQAWTDIARLCRNGIDAVNYGPGDPVEAHQKNEKVSIDQLVHCFEQLSLYLFKN